MSRKHYPSYKTSGVAWFGDVPSEWIVLPLRRFARMYAGGTPDKSNEDYWTEGTIPWLNSGAVNQELITEPSALITPEAFANSSAKWIPAGGLVMALAGQGKTKGMVAQLAISSTCNQSMAAILPNRKLINRFAYWVLHSQYLHIRNMAGGEQRDGLNLEILAQIPVPKPSICEQQRVAQFLDRETAKIDELIAKKRELIERLREKRTALISHVVTKGLPPEDAAKCGLPVNPPLKPSGVPWLGDVPQHWNTIKATRGFRVIGSGTTPKADDPDNYGGEVPWVTTSELREKVITETKQYVSDKALAEYSALKIYPVGTALIAMYGATIGRLGILGVEATLNQACCAYAYPLGLSTKFMYYWLWMRRPILISLSVGGGQPNLSQDDLRQLWIPAPDLTEQTRIVEFLDRETAKLDKLANVQEQTIERLQEYRSALITAAVTGKIDVRKELGTNE